MYIVYGTIGNKNFFRKAFKCEWYAFNMKLLTNQAQGPHWGISTRGRGSTDQFQQGPYKNDQGPIFPSTDPALS